MKGIKLLRMIFGILIAISISIMVILNNTLGAYRVPVEGTGFVYQEMAGAGGWEYDVDDDGNIYFAITTSGQDGISVYSPVGEYMYTLPYNGNGEIYVRIDEENNILIFEPKTKAVTKFNGQGIYIKRIYDNFTWGSNNIFHLPTIASPPTIRMRNGAEYTNIWSRIIRTDDDEAQIVFKVPLWHKVVRAAKIILALSCVAMFLSIGIPLWIKAYKERYG